MNLEKILQVAARGGASDIIWVDAPLCYSFHPLNAYDRPDGTVVIDLCVYERMFVDDREGPFGDSLPKLERWEIDPVRRTMATTLIDERASEFPRHNNRVGTMAHQFGYSVEVAADRLGATVKHDLVTGERTSFDWGAGRSAGEAVFVARDSSAGAAERAEDDGWLLAFVHADDGSSASFVVLDAQEVERGPVAEVVLPQRVPFGFHGNWVSDRSVPPPGVA